MGKYSREHDYLGRDPVERMKAYYSGKQEIVWLLDQFPWLALGSSFCPACDATAPRPLAQCVIHLNDEHKWSRERISEWLEKEVQR